MNKRKTIKKVAKGMLWLSLFMLLLLPAIPGHAQGSGVYLSVEGAPTAGEHTVSVFAQGMSPVYGADIRLAFDPNVLEVVDADEATPETIEVAHGDFLTSEPDFVLRNQANNQTGQIEYALVLVNPAPPVQGDGLLAKITFRARASGQAEVKLAQAQFGTQKGEVIEPALAAPVQFNVTQTESGDTIVETQAPTTSPGGEVVEPIEEVAGESDDLWKWIIIGAAIVVSIMLVLITMLIIQSRRLKQAQEF